MTTYTTNPSDLMIGDYIVHNGSGGTVVEIFPTYVADGEYGTGEDDKVYRIEYETVDGHQTLVVKETDRVECLEY